MSELEPFVREWHRQALPAITTHEFAETWYDFTIAWDKVAFPAGQGPLDQILAHALTRMPASASGYSEPRMRNLIALCCELQRRAGEGTFWLACRAAAATLGLSASMANRYLLRLQHDKVIELVVKGTRGRAAEYRYRGE